MSQVNRTAFNLIPEKWAFDPDIGPFIRELLSSVNGLRDRTGGDSDSIDDLNTVQEYQYTGNRGYRRFEDQMIDFEARMSSYERKMSRYVDFFDLQHDEISDLKRQKNALIQRISELEERIDSGT